MAFAVIKVIIMSNDCKKIIIIIPCYKLVIMPKKYYGALIVEFIKCLVVALMPELLYKKVHQKSIVGNSR